jgi:hypothetical protein
MRGVVSASCVPTKKKRSPLGSSVVAPEGIPIAVARLPLTAVGVPVAVSSVTTRLLPVAVGVCSA